MTSSPHPTDPARSHRFDRIRAAVRLGHAGPAAAAARAQRVQQRNSARADRAHRLAVARFGARPVGGTAMTRHHGG